MEYRRLDAPTPGAGEREVNKARAAAGTTGRLSVKNSRATRWAVSAGLAAMVAIGLVLLFLLTQATTNREMYERNYTRLFALNVVVRALVARHFVDCLALDETAPTRKIRQSFAGQVGGHFCAGGVCPRDPHLRRVLSVCLALY